MGQPAARVGDFTSHGTALSPGPGSSTVSIEGRPAWRVGIDQHLCPLTTGAQPHVGGTVATGSATVFINGHPATRLGDQVTELVGPNTIAIGAVTVMIG